jgi:NAD(P)-dependent dehydrogenase (short-subunit alcohol dehydrogenase family)
MIETILITGANRGIGLALSSVFAQYGWQVLACCRKPEKAKALSAIEAASEGRVKIHQLDVTDDRRIEALRRELEGITIDILCNNAGVGGPDNQGFGFLDESAWLETLRVNTIAPYKIIRALLDNVLTGGRRLIASIGSQMGSFGLNDSGGYYVYRTAKAGVHMVMKSLSIDLRGKGVTAVAFHPGWVRTDMGGPSAILSPEESAEGLFKTMLALTPANNGQLLNYRGEILPW